MFVLNSLLYNLGLLDRSSFILSFALLVILARIGWQAGGDLHCPAFGLYSLRPLCLKFLNKLKVDFKNDICIKVCKVPVVLKSLEKRLESELCSSW